MFISMININDKNKYYERTFKDKAKFFVYTTVNYSMFPQKHGC